MPSGSSGGPPSETEGTEFVQKEINTESVCVRKYTSTETALDYSHVKQYKPFAIVFKPFPTFVDLFSFDFLK